MFASVIEMQVNTGNIDELIDFIQNSDIDQIDGMRQFIVIDRGNDRALGIAIYDNQEQQESAGPKARELLGKMSSFLSAPPNRQGCAVLVNKSL
mgnify:CR=1 FL=1